MKIVNETNKWAYFSSLKLGDVFSLKDDTSSCFLRTAVIRGKDDNYYNAVDLDTCLHHIFDGNTEVVWHSNATLYVNKED